METDFVLKNARRWVMRPRPNNDCCIRLFCFPYAGGSASVFYSWAALLPPEIELCAVQLPGRQNRLREPLIREFGMLLEHLYEGLVSWLNTPFAFFGHSLGAIIAFEFDHYLAAQNAPRAAHLFVSGHRAPHIVNPYPPIANLSNEMFISTLRQIGSLPIEVLANRELRELTLPVVRADIELAEGYRFVGRIPGPTRISAFAGSSDEFVPLGAVAAWEHHTSSSFSFDVMPGAHMFIEDSRELVVEKVARRLMA